VEKLRAGKIQGNATIKIMMHQKPEGRKKWGRPGEPGKMEHIQPWMKEI